MLFPLLALAESALRRRRPRLEWLPLLAAGYALYRLASEHRLAEGAESRGFAEAPKRLVTSGPYGLSRNPMYLGHLLFLAGLAGLTRSPLAVAFLVWQWRRLSRRVEIDEVRLDATFGEEYEDYRARVPRWFGTIPTA